jgi:hypothetical protein
MFVAQPVYVAPVPSGLGEWFYNFVSYVGNIFYIFVTQCFMLFLKID